jgi:hypothetical protein
MERLGDTWLVNGGSIDASNRIIVGLDTAAGTGLDFALKDPMRPAAARPRFVLPVSRLVTDADLESVDGGASNDDSETPVTPDSWKSKLAETLEAGKSMGQRLAGIFTMWPPVWWEFGVNLEGGFWDNRYRSMDFPAQP